MIAIARPVLIAGALITSTFGRPADDIGFGVDQATILEKSFVENTTWQLETFDTVVDGEAMDSEMPDVRGTLVRIVRISDEYGKVEDGRIHALTREFQELSLDSNLTVNEGEQEDEFATSSESSLNESIVSFEWDELEEAYKVEVEEGDADDLLLDGLEIDMDLRQLLPTEAVEVGDTWKVPAEAFTSVAQAGGDLGFELAESDRGSVMGTPTAAILATSLASTSFLLADPTGEVTAKFIGTKEVEGQQLAEIRFEGKVSSERDLSEALQAAGEKLLEDGSADEWTLESTLDLPFDATLLWNLEQGHVQSFELEGSFSCEHDLAWTESMFDQMMSINAIYETAGTTSIKIQIGE